MGLAATVLFMASTNNGENMTQREIATAAGMTYATIRCRLRETESRELSETHKRRRASNLASEGGIAN
jgi:transcription initiation factor TFIIIB Brf1 subunit/transcription initiation factor TFIIB